MNKYKAESRAAQARRREDRMCLRKVSFASRELAERKGQRVYRCDYRKQWHRSGSLAQLAATCRRIAPT